MADIFTKTKRSAVMSAIRGKGNLSTELRLIAIFKERKVTGWRRNYPLIGRPDFVFSKRRLVVFVDGCFWHGCRIHYRRPKSGQDYWDAKVVANAARDRAVNRWLRKRKWTVVRVWEHELQQRHRRLLLTRLMKLFSSGRPWKKQFKKTRKHAIRRAEATKLPRTRKFFID